MIASKKTPRLPHIQSTVEPGLTHKATGPRVRVEQGFGGFLDLLFRSSNQIAFSSVLSWST